MKRRGRAVPSLALTGALLAGCTGEAPAQPRPVELEAAPEEMPSNGIEGTPLAELSAEAKPGDVGESLGIDPDDLPYEFIYEDGNMRDAEGETRYNVVSQLDISEAGTSYTAHEDLDPEISGYFEAALAESRELIEATADHGTLDHVHITRGLPDDEFTASSYNPIGEVVGVNLHESGVSYDELRAVLSHELFHAALRGLNYSEEEWEGAYSDACEQIEEIYIPRSLDTIKGVVGQLRQLIDENQDQYPEDYESFAEPLEAVDAYLEAGNGAEDIWLYCGQLSVGYALTDLDESVQGLGDDEMSDLYGLSSLKSIIDLPDDNPLKRAMLREFIEGDTVYKIFNESTYVESESDGALFLGHTAEANNFEELWASLMNTTVLYTDEFIAQIRAMEAAERDFTATMLELTMENAVELNPALAGVIAEPTGLVLDAINGMN